MRGKPTEEKLKSLCLEICQLKPFEPGLINALKPDERKEFLQLALDTKMDMAEVDELVQKTGGDKDKIFTDLRGRLSSVERERGLK